MWPHEASLLKPPSPGKGQPMKSRHMTPARARISHLFSPNGKESRVPFFDAYLEKDSKSPWAPATWRDPASTQQRRTRTNSAPHAPPRALSTGPPVRLPGPTGISVLVGSVHRVHGAAPQADDAPAHASRLPRLGQWWPRTGPRRTHADADGDSRTGLSPSGER